MRRWISSALLVTALLGGAVLTGCYESKSGDGAGEKQETPAATESTESATSTEPTESTQPAGD